MRYVHYGSCVFNPEIMTPVTNEIGFTKPNNGLWGSRKTSVDEWINFCDDNDMMDKINSGHFDFDLSPTANIVEIHKLKDLESLPKLPKPHHLDIYPIQYLDFEKMILDGIDAIELFMEDDYSNLYKALFCWDVSSILVMNPEVVIV